MPAVYGEPKPLYRVRGKYVCDECQQGELESTGVVFSSYPPQYQHECTACGKQFNLRQCYPRSLLVDADELAAGTGVA